MKKQPKTLGEVMVRDLAGFKLMPAYYLELEHGLMGFFPALISKTEKIVVCLEKELLVKVVEKLPRRRSKIEEIRILANIAGQYGFEMGNSNGDETERLHLLTEEEFGRWIKREKKPFKWAPGLIGEGMNEEEFKESLRKAAKQNQ